MSQVRAGVVVLFVLLLAGSSFALAAGLPWSPTESGNATVGRPGSVDAPSDHDVTETPTPDGGPDDTHGDESDESAGNDSTVAFYQVDFAGGEPIEQYGSAESGEFYADDGRLIRFLHGSSDDPVERERGLTETDGFDDELERCVDSQRIDVDDGEASVTFTVDDDCSVELSLVSYEKPDSGFSRESASEQVLIDAETETFGPGEHTLTVDLSGNESD